MKAFAFDGSPDINLVTQQKRSSRGFRLQTGVPFRVLFIRVPYYFGNLKGEKRDPNIENYQNPKPNLNPKPYTLNPKPIQLGLSALGWRADLQCRVLGLVTRRIMGLSKYGYKYPKWGYK